MFWRHKEMIVEALEMTYPDAEVENLTKHKILDCVVNLAEFNDDADRCDEQELEEIKNLWIRYREEHY